MNKTEQRAYRWLLKNGYKDIVFSGRATPDFITKDGGLFEVKKARNKTIWFGGGQASVLQELNNVKILVYDSNEGDDEPDVIIPYDEIQYGQIIWNNYRISGTDNDKNNDTINLKITLRMKDELIEKARDKCLSLSGYCRMVLADILKKEG